MKNKNILFSLVTCFIMSYSSTLYAEDNKKHTVYGGYAYGKVKTNKAQGFIVSYRYEPVNPWGIMVSFLYINSNNKENFRDERYTLPSIYQQKMKISSVLFGPTYRINPKFSLYAQMGPQKIQYREYKHHPKNSVTDEYHVDSTNIIGHVGVDYNPLNNVVVNLGYFYADTLSNRRHFELSGVQLSLGYRF